MSAVPSFLADADGVHVAPARAPGLNHGRGGVRTRGQLHHPSRVVVDRGCHTHAVSPGVAISYRAGISLFFGAVATGLLPAPGIGYVRQRSSSSWSCSASS